MGVLSSFGGLLPGRHSACETGRSLAALAPERPPVGHHVPGDQVGDSVRHGSGSPCL